MTDLTTISPTITHTSSKGEKFSVEIRRRKLTDAHTYWLYYIEAKHEKWGILRFHVFVTKQSQPVEDLADHLAKTLALEAAKGLLEEATETGRPLRLPLVTDGWAIM
jgi:hypothetical protein